MIYCFILYHIMYHISIHFMSHHTSYIIYHIISYYILYIVFGSAHLINVLNLIPTVPILFLTSPFFFFAKKKPPLFLLGLKFRTNERLICAQGASVPPLPSALYHLLRHVTARADNSNVLCTACGICYCSMRTAQQALTHTAVLPSGAAMLYRIVNAQSYL